MTIKADEEFETVIKRPPTLRRPANRDGEVAAEDHQDFLNRCHSLLAKGIAGLSLMRHHSITFIFDRNTGIRLLCTEWHD